MNISKEELRSLLELAFDKGWDGYFDLKQEYIDQIIENYMTKQPQILSSDLGITVSTTNITNSLQNTNGNYYYYCAGDTVQNLNWTTDEEII